MDVERNMSGLGKTILKKSHENIAGIIHKTTGMHFANQN